MDREGFRNRLKQYKEAKGFNPQLQYWEWKQQYDAAPQPDKMPGQPQSDQPTSASQHLDNRSHRWDNGYSNVNRDPFDSPYDDSRYHDYRKPRFEFRKGDVHYSNPNVLKWMGRFGKVLRGGSLLGEAVQNLFPSEEAELIEDLRVKMDKQNKWLTGQEDIPKYDDGTNKVVPTEDEYITQQIAAERAAALKKSYDRKYPRVPTSGGRRSKEEWEKSVNESEQYIRTLLSRQGTLPSLRAAWEGNLKQIQQVRNAGYDAYIGEGKILGPSCAYTTGDNYGIDCISSEQFRQNHADYGFREIPYSQVQPSDVVLDYNPEEQRATHTMMYSKKGADGVARFNHSNGGHTAEAIRKDARYPFKGKPLAYEYVGTAADSTQWKNEYKQLYGYADGGEVDDPRKQILNRSVKVASNYSDAKDFTLDPLNYAIRKISKTLTGRGGISNCTLSATGWVDPNNQYMSARNLFNNPESGYIEIDKAYALPGDLLVAKNPEKDSYHTMLIEGFNGDDPLLRYSRGGHNTKKNLVTGRSLEEYHRLDNEQGGNHTEDHYFRYNIPNEYWLPEIVVTPKK